MGWRLMIFCARATRGLRRPSLDARSEGQPGHTLERGYTKIGQKIALNARSRGSTRRGKVGHVHPAVHPLSRHWRRVHRSARARQEPAWPHREGRIAGGDRRAEAGEDLAGSHRPGRTVGPHGDRSGSRYGPVSPARCAARIDRGPGQSGRCRRPGDRTTARAPVGGGSRLPRRDRWPPTADAAGPLRDIGRGEISAVSAVSPARWGDATADRQRQESFSGRLDGKPPLPDKAATPL